MIAYQTAKGLAKRGHQVVLIAPQGSRCDGCEVIHTGPPGQWDEQKAYGTYWMHLPSFEAIIDHSWQKWALQLKGEGKLPQPVLCVLHAPVNTMMQTTPNVPKPCIVCISEDQASHYKGLFNADCRVAYNGIDVNYYKPMSVKRTDRFLFLARFSQIKGADIAIKACLDAGVGLDLIGDTSITNEPDYFALCQQLANHRSPNWDESIRGRQIIIHGGASRGECVRWFSQAHTLLHPNERFREPFGMAPVEAMLCGCPVIAWDNGAMRETIKHGEVGYLVKSFDELKIAIGAMNARDTMGRLLMTDEERRGFREWAKRFSVERMAERYEELCVEGIKTGGW